MSTKKKRTFFNVVVVFFLYDGVPKAFAFEMQTAYVCVLDILPRKSVVSGPYCFKFFRDTKKNYNIKIYIEGNLG